MSYPRALLAAAVVALAACGHAHVAPALRPELREKHALHRIRDGETLSSIARRYGVTLESLIELNEIEDPDRLRSGAEILIPGAVPAPDPPDGAGGARARPSAPGRDAEARSDRIHAGTVADCPRDRDHPSPLVSEGGLSWPVDGVVVSRFGSREGLEHQGIDIGAPIGTPIWASAEGHVLFAGEQQGYGNLIILGHEGGRVSLYARNAKNCVAEGQRVRRGQVIGLVGQSGGASSPYVHFEVRNAERAVNPRSLLP